MNVVDHDALATCATWSSSHLWEPLAEGPEHDDSPTTDRGRELLREIAGEDFEYDLQKWHDHLKVVRTGGYTWNRAVALPRIMKTALVSEEWNAAVDRIRRGARC